MAPQRPFAPPLLQLFFHQHPVNVVLAAKAAEMPLIDFAFKTTLPISIAAIIAMAIAHFFWQRFLDKKENISHEMLDVAEITTLPRHFTPFCRLPRLLAS